jgi:hypothetical protein
MILGQAVQIVDILRLPTGTTVTTAKITITDPDGNTVVNNADMTSEGNGIYSYVYESDDAGTEGNYTAALDYITSDGKTDKNKHTFRLNSQDNE